ncbi:MAG: C10 family peptidase [Prevotella sp.]|nr:C10 family peptidase [Prevotella sp.]
MNSKTAAFILLSLLGSGSVGAVPRTASRMKALAADELPGRQDIELVEEREHVALFGNAAGEGFVVLSRDDAHPAVLAVCPSSSATDLNPSQQWWLNAIDASLDASLNTGQPSHIPSYLPSAVEPLVKTQWGQEAPYNNWCPVGSDGTRCLTGCVATSTAQLMNYYQLPLRGQGSNTVYYPTGDTTGTPITVHFGATWIDWEHVRDNYKDGGYSDAEADAVAELMRMAGVSACMMYGTDAEGGSGANSERACQNLRRYFGFTDARYLTRDDYTKEQWMQMVYEQLSQYGPIVYDGDDQRGGHSFIIDGYREDGLVHVNWGYEGSGDGYYDIATLKPSFSTGGYADNQDMMLVRVDTTAARQTTLDLSAFPLTDGLLPAKAAYGHPYVTEVILPAGITQWGDGALGACPSLRTVVLPETEGRRFVLVDDQLICTPDTTELIAVLSTATGRVNVPSTVTFTHANALDGCVGIDTLDLPAALTRLDAEALKGCAGLKQLRVRAKTPPTLGGYDTFAGIWTDECHLNVPSGRKATYSTRAQWKLFEEIDEFGTTVKAGNAVRLQGEPNPKFGYTISGVPVSGVPELYTDATVDSPPGVYTIYIQRGTITADDVEFENGRLIVEPNTDAISTVETTQPRSDAAAYTIGGRKVGMHSHGLNVGRGKKMMGR